MSTGGMTLEKLQVIIEAETRPFREELAKMKAEMNSATSHVEKQTSKIRNAFSSLKGVISLALGAGLIKLGKDAITMASDLQEVQNVVDVAFGDMAYKCEAFAKTAIKQFGMSELSAKQTASTFMAMGKGIGMASDQASDMAIQIAARSADVASFFNISQSEAATKLKSIYTGETETLKDLGVVMTQVNLKQYALAHGMSDNIEQMDQASLTTLRYKFVMDQLALAEGDFARTSGSWANQVRILKEQWKQLLGIIGNGLMAIFTPVINVLNKVLSKILQFAQVVQAVFSLLFGKKGNSANDSAKKIGTSLGTAEDNAGGLNDNLDKTSDKAKKAAKAMGQLASIDEINNMTSSTNSDSGTGGTGSISGIDAGSFDWGLDKEADTSGIDKTVAKIKKEIEGLKKFLEKYKVPITSIMAGIVAALGTLWMIKNWGSLISPIKNLFINLSALIGIIKDVGIFETFSAMVMGVSTPMAAIVIAVAAVVASLVYLWQTSDEFRNNVMEAVQSLMGVLQNIYENVLVPLFAFLGDVFATVLMPIGIFIADVIVTAVDLVANVALALWTNVLVPLANFLVNILAIALKGVIQVWEAWKPVIDMIYAVIMTIWNEVLKPIVEWIKHYFITIFEEWGKVIDELLPHVEEMFTGLIDFFVGVFTLDLDKCWQGIKEIFQGFDDFLSGVFSIDWEKSFGSLGKVLNTFFADLKVIWDGIKKMFNGIIEFITGIFTGDWKKAWNGVKDIFKGMWDSLKGIVKLAWDAILVLFKNGGKIFSGVVDGIAKVFKTIVNCIIDGLNKVIAWPFNKINQTLNDIRDIDIPLIGKPFAGLWGYNPIYVPQIPKLARGAVVTTATPAIFGEAGAEAVMPLENNTGWMAKIAYGISGYMHGGMGEDLNDLIILMQELIDIVRDKDTNVYIGIDDDKMNEMNRRAERLRRLRTG